MTNSFPVLSKANAGQWQITGIILINWYLFDCEFIPVRGVTAICGGNGSGKSTILDAAQLILHGGDKTKAVFNASAERSNRHEGRKLIDYCLGMLAPRSDGGIPTREQADTRIALVFTCQSTGKSLTAGLAYSASAQDDNETLESRFIIDGGVDETFFVSPGEDGEQYVMEVSSLQAKAKERGLQFSPFTSSNNFAEALSRGLQSSYGHYARPDLYRRAIKTAISLKEINDPNSFVKNYVLDPNPLKIDTLREDISRYRTYRDHIAKIEAEIAELGKVVSKADECTGKLRELDFCEFADINGRFLADEIQLGDLKAKHQKTKDEHDKEVAYKARSATTIEELSEELKSKEIQAQSSDVAKEVRLIDMDIKAKEDRVSKSAQGLRDFYALSNVVVGIVGHAARAEIELGDVLGSLHTAASLVDAPFSSDEFSGRVVGLSEHLQAAARGIPSIVDKVKSLGDAKRHARSKAMEDRKILQEKIDRIKKGGNPLSPDVESFYLELQSRGLHPRLLCDLVDVKDESWRAAIESLLGRGREAILVPPEKLDRAIEAQKYDRNRFGDCDIVYTKDAQGYDRSTNERSLAAVVKVSDPYAKAYIDVRLGSYIRVDDISGFEGQRSAVTRDVQVKSAMSVRTLRPPRGGYILGKTAQLNSLPMLQSEVANLKTEIDHLTSIISDIDGFLLCADRLTQAAGLIERVVGDAEDFRQAKRDIVRLAQSKAVLIEGEDSEILREIEALRAEIAERKEEAADLNARIDHLIRELVSVEKDLNAVEGRYNNSRDDLAKWRENKGDEIHTAASNDFELRVIRFSATEKSGKSSVLSRVAHDGKVNADRLRAECEKAKSSTYGMWTTYLGKFPSSDSNLPAIEILPIREWCVNRKRSLEEADLVSFKEKAEEALHAIEKGFMEDFLLRLKSCIVEMERRIEDYNTLLRSKSFNGERYSFDKKIKPEYESIVNLARNPGIAFAEHVPEVYRAALGTMNAMIDDPSFDSAKFEDYREFFDYDIIIKNPGIGRDMRYSTRKSVGSGGEGQAPFYVAVASSLATAFHGSSEPLSVDYYGFAPAMFDEAFSKLDGVNIRQVMQFMTDIHLQVIVAAPTEKRTSFMSSVDTMIDLVKDVEGKSVHVSPAIVGQEYKDEMEKSDPHLMTVDAYKAKFPSTPPEMAPTGTL